MTGGRSSYGQGYWAGFERGVQSGHAAGYCEGVSVLNEAADLLAELRPSKTVGIAAARQRMREATGPSLTPRQIRIQAAKSWGLPVPTDLAEATSGPTTGGPEPATGGPATAAAPAPPVAELADDDDWAWQL